MVNDPLTLSLSQLLKDLHNYRKMNLDKNTKCGCLEGGFLGSYVVAELAEKGWRVRIADLVSPPEEIEFEDYVITI